MLRELVFKRLDNAYVMMAGLELIAMSKSMCSVMATISSSQAKVSNGLTSSTNRMLLLLNTLSYH
jgi:hypothetical protein